MKQLLLASTALALGTQAFAADMPARMPVKAPIVAPAFSWTGCHVGAHVGAGWGKTDVTEPQVAPNPGIQLFGVGNVPVGVDSGASFVGGVQAGCDYQFAQNWVIGAAGDFSWTSLDGSAIAPDPFFNAKSPAGISVQAKTDWLATATARLGYAWDRWMIYGKGGAAWAHDKYAVNNMRTWGAPLAVNNTCGPVPTFASCNASSSSTNTGWTAGLGLEWAFAANWSALAEYNHYQFGTRTVTLVATNATFLGTTSAPVSVKESIDTFRLGINYRFFGQP